MRIALCDDNLTDLNKIKELLLSFSASGITGNDLIIKEYNNATTLLFDLEHREDFDLLIIDIIMPGLNGLQLASEIRSHNNSCRIIFISSSPDFALSSYKVDAFYYLLKPVMKHELFPLLEKAKLQMDIDISESVLIKTAKSINRIHFNMIQYVESMRHVINFHLSNSNTRSCYGTISEFAGILLSDRRFVKCHKSYIINMDYVATMTTSDFVMDDGTIIPISRNLCQQIKNDYLMYIFTKTPALKNRKKSE